MGWPMLGRVRSVARVVARSTRDGERDDVVGFMIVDTHDGPGADLFVNAKSNDRRSPS
jgi:hypothetical protein